MKCILSHQGYGTTRYNYGRNNDDCNIVLLRDVCHVGLIIGPRTVVLAWGVAEGQLIQQTEEL